MNKNKILYAALCCICIAATSCSKQKTANLPESNSDLLTSQVEKIETFLADGARKEIITDPAIPKVETSASAELRRKLQAQTKKEIEESYKKRTVGTLGVALNPYAFAVFKSSSCWGYPELEIKMDCEDNRPATTTSGWVGDSYMDAARDIHFKFCVVDDDYSRYLTSNGSKYAFGFLYLGETYYFTTDPHTYPYPTGVSRYFWPWNNFIRVFDNEDSGNDNKVWFGGYEQPLTFWLGPSAHAQASYVSGNTRLHFMVAPDNPSGGNYAPGTSIPGMTEYGVLGKFGANQGLISCDDEDTNNQNVAEVGGYYAHINDATGQWVTNTFPYASTIEPSGNTILHLSKK